MAHTDPTRQLPREVAHVGGLTPNLLVASMGRYTYVTIGGGSKFDQTWYDMGHEVLPTTLLASTNRWIGGSEDFDDNYARTPVET